jgi:hypothetical protein
MTELTEPRHRRGVPPAADGYPLDIRLQGDHETVFFAL